ncbi:MAG: glycosyltransferase family 39 protein [Acidobacteriota bacterium]|nr:glycosyltransferase family 39 protein [Acidobacteriota bacterium]
MSATTSSRPARISDPAGALCTGAATALVSAAAVCFFLAKDSILAFGDAESHLNIARRVFDSRTPGFEQLGSPWLPLPQVLMLPLVGNMTMWQTGMAGSIPSGLCFAAAAAFLYATAFHVFKSRAAAATAAALFVLNPNVLYLQAIPMTESAFFAALLGLLYFTVRYADDPGWHSAAGAGAMALATTLTRYEGWFLLPFSAAFVLLTGGKRRIALTALFSLIAIAGPLFWLGYNHWYFGDALYFYRGPYSAKAIQGGQPYPGKGDWIVATYYFATAAKLVVGAPLFWMGLAGAISGCTKRAIWPVALLSLPPVFYIWSMHSSGTPIYIPVLAPFTWYNSRYGLAALPLLAFACAGLFNNRLALALLIPIAIGPWLLHPHMANWVTWKESQVNNSARMAWTHEGAAYFRANLGQGDTIFTNTSDITGIYREAGIPLRKTLTVDNGPYWAAAIVRPEIFARDHWAVASSGDAVEKAVARVPAYVLVKEFAVKSAAPIRIYHQ